MKKTIQVMFILAVFLFWLSNYIYFPTLPEYILSKTNTLTLVGIVLSMYGLWQAVIRLPLGLAVDSLGKRKLFIMGGIALAGIGAVIMGFSNKQTGLILGRSLIGLSMGTWVLMVVVFSSFFPSQEAVRAGSILTLVSSVAKLIATSATGYLNNIGGYILAFLVSAAAAGTSIILLLPLPESRPEDRKLIQMPFLSLLKHKKLVYSSLLAIINQFINFSVTFGFLPILARQMGAGDVTKSMLISTNILALIAGNLIVTRVIKHLSSLRLLVLSFILFSVGATGTGLAPGLLWLFGLQILLGIAHGIAYPVLIGLSIEDVDVSQRATAMGLHQTVYALGMFIGPWLSGTLADRIGLRPTFAVIGFLCLVLSMTVIHRLVRSSK